MAAEVHSLEPSLQGPFHSVYWLVLVLDFGEMESRSNKCGSVEGEVGLGDKEYYLKRKYDEKLTYLTPWVLDHQETLALVLYRSKHGVGVPVFNSLPAQFIGVWMAVLSSTGAEEEFFIYVEKALCPQLVKVENISRDNLSRNPSR